LRSDRQYINGTLRACGKIRAPLDSAAYDAALGGQVAKPPRAQVLSSETVYQGPVFGVRRDRVREPGGVEATRDVVTHSGSVVVLPVFDDGRILLVRQYRHAVGEFLWELVAGRKDPGENFVRGAHRELVEETCYRARRMRRLTAVYASPGFVVEELVIFLATGLTAGAATPEEDERIALRKLPLRQALDWIRTGKIRDSKSLAAILYYATFVSTSARKKR
jgi:ADP-ribose pyrophosphatase